MNEHYRVVSFFFIFYTSLVFFVYIPKPLTFRLVFVIFFAIFNSNKIHIMNSMVMLRIISIYGPM
jgi:hypothetical protein